MYCSAFALNQVPIWCTVTYCHCGIVHFCTRSSPWMYCSSFCTKTRSVYKMYCAFLHQITSILQFIVVECTVAHFALNQGPIWQTEVYCHCCIVHFCTKSPQWLQFILVLCSVAHFALNHTVAHFALNHTVAHIALNHSVAHFALNQGPIWWTVMCCHCCIVLFCTKSPQCLQFIVVECTVAQFALNHDHVWRTAMYYHCSIVNFCTNSPQWLQFACSACYIL